MLRTSVIALAIATTAGMVHAAGPAAPEPAFAAPTARSWEGGYVGGQLGYAYSEFDLNSNSLSNFDKDSVSGGITAGYLWALGQGWYMGPEFQYDWTDLSVTDNTSGQTATFDGIARLKLIAGYELGNGLLYGTAGFAYADFDNVGSIIDIDKNSYVVGIGYDWRVTDEWTVGAEYLYHNFDSVGSAGGDIDLNTIQLRAAYRF